MTCIEIFQAAVAAAELKLSQDIEACNDDAECEQAAVQAYADAVKAAEQAYYNCIGNPPNP